MYFEQNGFKDEVAIIGMGCSKFGERWDTGLEDLIIEAAFADFSYWHRRFSQGSCLS